jgi:hypothetical protein
MLKTKFLSWFLRTFYGDYSIAFQTVHTPKVGIRTEQSHSLIERVRVEAKELAISVQGPQSDTIICDSYYIIYPSAELNPFIATDFSAFWELVRGDKMNE